MLRRAFATADVLSVHPAGLSPRLAPTIVRSAHRAVFHYDPKPGMLYVRSRAISSRCNDNFDYFPADEIKTAYRTFVGKPVFVNHHNDDHKRMRGLILDAALHEDRNPDGSPDTWAEVLMEVDGLRYPKLARALIRGDIDRTSMGCDVETSTCSACGNVATMPSQYCSHIPGRKGNRIAQAFADGRSELKLIFEECRGLSFFENSLLVEPPADPTAFFTHSVELGPGLAHLAKSASAKPRPSLQLDKPVEILPREELVRWRDLSRNAALASANSSVWRLLAKANSASRSVRDLNGEVWRLLHQGNADNGEPRQESEFLKNYPSDSEIDEMREGGFGGQEPWHPYRHELESRPEPRVGLPQQVKGEFKGPNVGTVYSRVPHGTPGAMNAPSPQEEYHGPYEVMRHAQTDKYHVVDNQDRVTNYGGRNGMDDRFKAEHARDYAEHKQRSKEIARGIADKLWSGFQEAMDPGGTDESRESERNVHSMNNLQNLGYQPHHIKFDDEDGGRPYAEVEHTLPGGKKTGWFGVDHGGSGYLEIKHRATGDESHDVINLSQHESGQNFRKPGYGPDEAHADLHHWHSGSEEDTGGIRQHLEQNDPRIRRWQQRHAVRMGNNSPSSPGNTSEDLNGKIWRLLHEGRNEKPVSQMDEDEYAQHQQATTKAKADGERWNRQHPVKIKNIVDHWNQATPDEKANGENWYADAHHLTAHIARDTGVPMHTMAGLMSNYSPQTHWATNIMNAARVARTGQALGGPGGGIMATSMQKRAANRLLAGEHYDDVLAGRKTKAFAHLIEYGGDADPDDPKVVIDRHALSVATGVRATENAYAYSRLGTKSRYDQVSQAYHKAAKQISRQEGRPVAAHQVQAATWLVRQRLNEQQDRELSQTASSGSTSKARLAIAKWNQYAGEHHPAAMGKEPGTGYSGNVPEDVQHATRMNEEGVHNPKVATYIGGEH